MPIHRLLDKDGTLYFPHGGHDDSWNQVKDAPSMLMHRYGAGDVDTLPWPLKSQFRDEVTLKKQLAGALYDERECNEFFGIDGTIELPDGTPFDFDAIIAEYNL